MKDLSGDGILGGKSRGHYKLGKKYRQHSFIALEVLYVLLIVCVVGIIVFTLLALSNNKLGIEAMQTMIGGVK